MKAINVYTKNNCSEKFSRWEAINWVNSSLNCCFKKVEELCTGDAFCQLFDMIFPGSIPLRKVKFNPHLEHEYIHNFKILQAAFEMYHVNRLLEVESLVKGVYKTNFDLVFWFHKFYKANRSDVQYSPSEARDFHYMGAPLIDSKGRRILGPLNMYTHRRILQPATHIRSCSVCRTSRTADEYRPRSRSRVRSSRGDMAPRSSVSSCRSRTKSSPPMCRDHHIVIKSVQELLTEMDAVKEQEIRFKFAFDAVQKDRDFYYRKLLDVEKYCSQHVNGPFKDFAENALKIVYENQTGFASPGDRQHVRFSLEGDQNTNGYEDVLKVSGSDTKIPKSAPSEKGDSV